MRKDKLYGAFSLRGNAPCGLEGGCMGKIKYREAKMCIFCKHWIGQNPDVNYMSGECKLKPVKGKCAMDATDQEHEADGLCHRFDKSILYL